jgi:hypothetical protein
MADGGSVFIGDVVIAVVTVEIITAEIGKILLQLRARPGR